MLRATGCAITHDTSQKLTHTVVKPPLSISVPFSSSRASIISSTNSIYRQHNQQATPPSPTPASFAQAFPGTFATIKFCSHQRALRLNAPLQQSTAEINSESATSSPVAAIITAASSRPAASRFFGTTALHRSRLRVRNAHRLQQRMMALYHSPQRHFAQTSPFSSGSGPSAYPKATKTRSWADIYEGSATAPHPELPKSRFIKNYGVERNLYGQDVQFDQSVEAEPWLRGLSPNPKGTMSSLAKFLKSERKYKKAKDRNSYVKIKRQHWHHTIDFLVAAVFVELMTGSDIGFQFIGLLGSLAFVLMFGIPFFLIFTFIAYARWLWKARERKEMRKQLMEEYTGDPFATPEEQEESTLAIKDFETKSILDTPPLELIDDALESVPRIDSVQLQEKMLASQQEEIEVIRASGPKGMLDFMLERVRVEQDELRMDRDVVEMNIQRIKKLLKTNNRLYQRAVRHHRPAHVIEHFEQTISEQKVDLAALYDEVDVIDTRGYELKSRVDNIQQQLHNAVYSTIQGIQHPVMFDLVANDLIDFLLGHPPSEILDQQLLLRASPALQPLQEALLTGKKSIEEVRDILESQFSALFPPIDDFPGTLPEISLVSNQNIDRSFDSSLQFVADPLIDPGSQTKQLIKVAVDQFTREFEEKYDDFLGISPDSTDGLSPEQRANKLIAQQAHFEQRQIDLSVERNQRSQRYSQSEQLTMAYQRRLGRFANSEASIKPKANLPGPLPSPSLFVNDHSFVSSFDSIVSDQQSHAIQQAQRKRDLDQRKAKLETLRKEAGSLDDPRILHEMETQRIAFGPQITLPQELDREEVQKYWKMLQKLGKTITKQEKEQVMADIDAQPSFWSGTMFQQRGYRGDSRHKNIYGALLHIIRGEQDTYAQELQDVEEEEQFFTKWVSIRDELRAKSREKALEPHLDPRFANDPTNGLSSGSKNKQHQPEPKSDIDDKFDSVFPSMAASFHPSEYSPDLVQDPTISLNNVDTQKESTWKWPWKKSKKPAVSQKEIETINQRQADWNSGFDDISATQSRSQLEIVQNLAREDQQQQSQSNAEKPALSEDQILQTLRSGKISRGW